MGNFHFDAERHVYTLNGVVLPSVTDIIKPITDEAYAGISRDAMETAADRGRRVHLTCSLHDENDLDEASVEDDVAPYLSAYRKFLRETGAEVIANERSLYHPLLGFGGTPDRVFRFPITQKFSLTDLKATAEIMAASFVQVMGYDVLHQGQPNAIKCDEHAVLHLRADGTYRYITIPTSDKMVHVAEFHALRAHHLWRKRFYG